MVAVAAAVRPLGKLCPNYDDAAGNAVAVAVVFCFCWESYVVSSRKEPH